MKIATFNAQIGIGSNDNWFHFIVSKARHLAPNSAKKLKEFGKMIDKESIDIVTLTEIEGKSFRSRWYCQVGAIQQSCQLRYKRFFRANKWLFGIMNQGNGIVTKYNIKADYKYLLPAGFEPRILGQTTLEVDGREIDIFVTHLSLGKKDRELQIRKIAYYLGRSKRPFILSGDFNIKNSSELDIIAKNIHRPVKFKSHKTHPSWRPSKSLDYIFLSPEFKILKSYTIQTPTFSDHLPLVYEIEFK